MPDLFEAATEGGLGFCQAALGTLLPADYHGPLVVALDSSVLIDLRDHGEALLDDVLPEVAVGDKNYAGDLNGLADLLNLWLLRDIRFVVTPRSLTDLGNDSDPARRDRRQLDVEAVDQALTFQFGDWTVVPPSEQAQPLRGTETGLPDGPDRDLVLEAQGARAHVFLTRDKKVLRRVSLSGPQLHVMPPKRLASALAAADVRLFSGGTCGRRDCYYTEWAAPAPDIGRWGPFMSLFQGRES